MFVSCLIFHVFCKSNVKVQTVYGFPVHVHHYFAQIMSGYNLDIFFPYDAFNISHNQSNVTNLMFVVHAIVVNMLHKQHDVINLVVVPRAMKSTL